MNFRNARFKIRESEYFLNSLKEKYADETLVNYYNNAFLSSTNSVIDYIRQDFFDEIKFNVSNRDWKNRKREIIKRNKHSDLINKFLSEYDRRRTEFSKEPLNFYFINRRNTITHRSGADIGKQSLIQAKNGKIIYIKRYLESPYNIEYVMDNPHLWIDFGHDLNNEDRYMYESKLRGDDMYVLLKQFFRVVKDFLECYEKDYCDFSCPEV